MNLIFCLKICSDWDTLIKYGSSVRHNFFTNKPNGACARQSCLYLRQGKARLLFSRKERWRDRLREDARSGVARAEVVGDGC